MSYYDSNEYNLGINEEIHTRILDLFDYALNLRSRNLVIRCDIRFPDDDHEYDEAAYFRRFIATFVQNRNRTGVNCLYFWKREKVNSIHGHYHVAFLMDGRVTQNLYGHMAYANKLWNSYFPSNNDYTPGEYDDPHKDKRLVYYRNHQEGNGPVINKNHDNFRSEVLRMADWMGYIAKNYSANSFGKRGNSWGCSQNIPVRSIFNHFSF